MEFIFSGSMTFNDYVQFNRFLLRKIIMFKLILYIFCLMLIVFVSGFFDFSNDFSFDSSTFLFGIAFFLLIYSIIYLLFSKKRYRKIFDSNKTIEEECHYIINEKNIKISSETGNSILTDETIHKIIFDKDSIYIFLAVNMAKMIKKRFLENDEEYEKLVIFIKENYKGKISKK